MLLSKFRSCIFDEMEMKINSMIHLSIFGLQTRWGKKIVGSALTFCYPVFFISFWKSSFPFVISSHFRSSKNNSSAAER